MTSTFWWMLGADAFGLAVLGLVLIEVAVSRSRARPAPVRPAPAHCRARGRRTVARTLDQQVLRLGARVDVIGRHRPEVVSGTVAQRRLSETMEFAAVTG